MKHFPNPQVWEMSLMYISLEQTTLKVINISNKQFWMHTFNFFLHDAIYLEFSDRGVSN